MKEYRLGKDGKLYNFNITPEVKARGSKVVTRYKWGDGDDGPVGQRIAYTIRVYGNPDDIDNKFPDQAEPEPPGDPDADTPVAIDPANLFPSAFVDKAKSALSKVGAAVDDAVVKSKQTLEDLTQTKDVREPLQDAATNIKALIAEAKRQLDGGRPESFVEPEKVVPTVKGVVDGAISAFDIDRTKPYRETLENGELVRVYGELEELDELVPKDQA